MYNFKKGWIPDVPDFRDFKFAPSKVFEELPEKFDLSSDPSQPPIYNQRRIG